MKTIYLVRGLPGSGKSTLARLISPSYNVAADDHFTDSQGIYRFKIEEISIAHERCQKQTEIWMISGVDVISVHNTFVQAWEIAPYVSLAEKHDYEIRIVDLYDGGLTDEMLYERNVHGVPLDAIQRMRLNYCLLKDLSHV